MGLWLSLSRAYSCGYQQWTACPAPVCGSIPSPPCKRRGLFCSLRGRKSCPTPVLAPGGSPSPQESYFEGVEAPGSGRKRVWGKPLPLSVHTWGEAEPHFWNWLPLSFLSVRPHHLVGISFSTRRRMGHSGTEHSEMHPRVPQAMKRFLAATPSCF